MLDLEKDWEETAKQISGKLQEATLSLREALRLANEAGVDELIVTQYTYDCFDHEKIEFLREKLKDINNAVRDFESELDNAGWSTSSSYC